MKANAVRQRLSGCVPGVIRGRLRGIMLGPHTSVFNESKSPPQAGGQVYCVHQSPPNCVERAPGRRTELEP